MFVVIEFRPSKEDCLICFTEKQNNGEAAVFIKKRNCIVGLFTLMKIPNRYVNLTVEGKENFWQLLDDLAQVFRAVLLH